MTTISDPHHRLAALLAVERDAAEDYRRASRQVLAVSVSSGVDTDEYRTAAGLEDDAMRAMITARCDVDAALADLAMVEVAA